jgi:kynurenine formamidase
VRRARRHARAAQHRLESSEATLRWLWEHRLAAVAGDHTSFEAWPCQDERFLLHKWLLSGCGLPMGELFDLEKLSEECAKGKRWSFFFSSVLLYVSVVGLCGWFVVC